VGVATVATPLSCTNPRHPSLGHGRIALSYSAGPLPYWSGLASHGNPFAGIIMEKAWVTLPSRPTVWLSMWLQPALTAPSCNEGVLVLEPFQGHPPWVTEEW
jgi:hypothetical protein